MHQLFSVFTKVLPSLLFKTHDPKFVFQWFLQKEDFQILQTSMKTWECQDCWSCISPQDLHGDTTNMGHNMPENIRFWVKYSWITFFLKKLQGHPDYLLGRFLSYKTKNGKEMVGTCRRNPYAVVWVIIWVLWGKKRLLDLQKKKRFLRCCTPPAMCHRH